MKKVRHLTEGAIQGYDGRDAAHIIAKALESGCYFAYLYNHN